MIDNDGLVVVKTGDDLLLFSSVGAAVAYMEPIDIEEGEYQAVYNRSGHLLRLGVRKTPTTHLFGLIHGTREYVTISPDDETPSRAGELAAIIRAYLMKRGEHLPEGATLDTLLVLMEKRVGFAI